MTTGRSTVLVPTPWAEPVVAGWRERHDWSARLGVPAHITVMGPFLDPGQVTGEVVARLRSIVGSVPPISFSLTRLVLRSEVALLLPEPAEPFEQLSAAIQAGWASLAAPNTRRATKAGSI